jgi:hypothetical protein
LQTLGLFHHKKNKEFFPIFHWYKFKITLHASAEVALKFGSEIWVLKKREEQRLI